MVKLILTTYGVFERFSKWYVEYIRLNNLDSLYTNEYAKTCPIRLSGWLNKNPGEMNTNYVEVFIPIEHYLHITETLEEGQN